MSAAVRHVLLLVVATLASLLLCELFVRAFVTVRNVGPSFSVYDPVYGKTLRPNASIERVAPEFSMRLTTNSLGFRGPEPVAPPRGVLLFLGDSFTMGYGVDDGEEFPALVRARLAGAGVPVVNAGIGNSGNGRWLKFLRREAPTYSPRAVVLQVHANDFDDNLREGLFRLGEDGQLVELPVPPAGLGRLLQEVVEAVPGLSSSHLVGLAKQLSWPHAGPAEAPPSEAPPAEAPPTEAREPDAGERLTLQLVAESVHLCRSHGWPVLVVLADVPDPRRSWLRDAAEGEGAFVVTIPEKRVRPDLYFTVDGHWTRDGQAFTAARILEQLPSLGVPVPAAEKAS